MEERRLAYVAFTRAARRLTVSGHYWGRTQQKPLGPSQFLSATREWLDHRGISPLHWADPPDQDATNPHLQQADGIAWPAAGPGLNGRRALAADVLASLDGRLEQPDASEADRADLARLDALEHDLELLAIEAAESVQDVRVVPWPSRMSATSAMALTKDPVEFARGLARPMPRRPSSAARFGTRFHAWIEDHYGMAGLFDPTDLPGRGDAGIDSDAELERLKETFLASEFAARTPEEIEAPFSLVLGGQQFGGRIDAVFSRTDADGGKRYEVVDWKTNEQANADPLQLSIYRLAWAELRGVDLVHVTAAFYYVRLGETVRPGPDELLDRAGLEQVLGLRAVR
jgi:DNA helicase-2/ATP-dependent DNA helicase PcrA